MLFLNPVLLFGLLGVSVPIVLHLLRRRAAKPVQWGAMRFLGESVTERTSRIELEEALLMATRCLIVGMIALAFARPFSPVGSKVPWAIVLPGLLLAIAALGCAFALWSNRRRRWSALIVSALLFSAVIAAVVFERQWNLRRLGGGDAQNVALVIDASTSMRAEFGDETRFEQAIAEARQIVALSRAGTTFSVILAGPSAQLLTSESATSRDDIDRQLAGARPSDGTMALPHALREAALQLAKGGRGGSRIVLITDGQSSGWDTKDSEAWKAARSPIGTGGERPQLILRQLPPPKEVRNAAITQVALGRDAIGTDRPLEIEVTVANTGTEALTPDGVQLRVGDTLLENQTLGQLVPGTQGTARFSHRFRNEGAHAITARLLADDQLAADNVLSRALTVTTELKVLIVDGNPGGRTFDRASAFLELALAPGTADSAEALVKPVVLPAPQIAEAGGFDGYSAVILADVHRLPAASSANLARWVEGGGGLLIAPGKRADSGFYDGWQSESGAYVTPAQITQNITVPAEATTPIRLALDSFDHQSLRKAAAPESSDLDEVRIANYWRLEIRPNVAAASIATLDNGDPFLALAHLGSGTVMLSTIPFDNRASNLVGRSGFLPLAHELVYYLARSENELFNLPPAPPISFPIRSPERPTARYAVLDPRGETRLAELRDRRVHVDGETMAGLYEIEIPPADRDAFPQRLTAAGTLPFTIGRPAEESDFTQLSAARKKEVGEFFELLEARDRDDVLAALAGESFGEELWPYLAFGALFLLIAEALLSRWITRARRIGAEDGIEFSARAPTGSGIGSQLDQAQRAG